MTKRLHKTTISFLLVLLVTEVLICAVRSETGESINQAVEGTTDEMEEKRSDRYKFRLPCFMARCVRRRSSSKRQQQKKVQKDIS